MKLKFKKQAYQTNAVEAVADCFAGQPKREGLNYRIDPGRAVDASGQAVAALESSGFKNADLALTPGQVLENIHAVQRRQNLPLSAALVKTKVCDINLDVEMETGTGKTYCYIKTMFELNARYGWSKFIVVVPSVAIREGVHKSLEITADHFQDDYKKRARFLSTTPSSCTTWKALLAMRASMSWLSTCKPSMPQARMRVEFMKSWTTSSLAGRLM